MIQFIQDLVNNDYLATVLISFFPLIELKGGIVFARASMGFFSALALSYLGSTVISVLVYFLLKPILSLLKKIKFFNNFAVKIENYFQNKAEKTVAENKNKSAQKNQVLLKQLAVFIFVAIPLPMTGIWTGTAIAVFLGLKFKEIIWPVGVGNLIAGIIISILAEICIIFWDIKVLDYILYGLFALALILLVVVLIKVSKSTKKDEN